MKKPLKWVPLWIDPWLFGSTRIEFTIEQRAIWIDLLALAGKDSGFIRANEGVPYPLEQLAGLLRAPVDLLEHTINRCLETGKLTKMQDVTLYVTNWDSYKLTPQYRRRLAPKIDKEKTGEEEHKIEESIVEKNKREESKGKGNHVSPKRNTVSKKGNNLIEQTENKELPPIPKHASFKNIEKLETLREEIRYREEILKDERKLKLSNYTEEELTKQIKKQRDEYFEIIGSYER